MSDARQIEAEIYERLSKVIDLSRSVTDLGMIAAIEATPADMPTLTLMPGDVTVHVELTVLLSAERNHYQPDQRRSELPYPVHACCPI